MTIKRIAVGFSAAAIVSVGLILPASANHGPNCDQPREDVVAFLQDNIDEWEDYDDDGDGVACETTHQLTKDDIKAAGGAGDNGAGDKNDDDDDQKADDDGDENGDADGDDAGDIPVPTEIDTGR